MAQFAIRRFFLHIAALPVTSSHNSKNIAELDALTGGAFTAATSSERAACVRTWLATGPSPERMNEVFKELSTRDKGAARALREKLDELKRAKGQEVVAAEWAAKAQTLIDVAKLNIADALAWQRDAAKAGAPLSKEPLAALKVRLADRVKVIEDLQHRVQVQREAAVLLAQRIEVLSMKPWRDSQAVWDGLRADISGWQEQATGLQADTNWASVDMKFPPLLEASRAQLLVVWDAFQGALAQAVAASDDATAPLPSVAVWADELRAFRGQAQAVVYAANAPPAKPKIDPEVRAAADAAVREVLTRLEAEIAEGHGKASAGAANALRNALKEHGRIIHDRLEAQANAALAAATELEGWQRWSADRLREELVNKAEALLKREAGQELGGRKMQENLRTLREHWKQTDQGGVPNHGLWKRFDEACNQAYKVVEAWLEKMKAQSAEHRAQRTALIEEVNAWAAANTTALDGDWKGFHRILHQFGDRWRDAGHLGEKDFGQMQPLWQAAIGAAAAPLEARQKESIERRNALIEEAKTLGAAPVLRVDAVRSLQQRWQHEAQGTPLERRFEQKQWDAFRKPLDDAFNRKTQEREKAEAALSDRDRTVLDAAKAVETANASGDAQAIRAALAQLEAALKGQQAAQAKVVDAKVSENKSLSENGGIPSLIQQQSDINIEANLDTELAKKFEKENLNGDNLTDSAETVDAAEAVQEAVTVAVVVPAPAPVPVKKPVVAVRGDDRPGMKKAEPAMARGGKFGAGRPGDRGDRGGRDSGRDTGRDSARGPRHDGFERPERNPAFDLPRLGDAAFRAQRDALESAQMALKKLAARAHGEAVMQLLGAWESRNADQVPSVQDLGGPVNASIRTGLVQAIASPVQNAGDAGNASATALLRLEMATEVPTPAEHLSARRALQLQLLTRRNDPAPLQTWGQDLAKVLAGDHAPEQAKRLQNVLKALLRKN